jgi:hypothetical protein
MSLNLALSERYLVTLHMQVEWCFNHSERVSNK